MMNMSSFNLIHGMNRKVPNVALATFWGMILALGLLASTPESLAHATHGHTSDFKKRTQVRTEFHLTPVLADVEILQAVNAKILATEDLTRVGFAELSEDQMTLLSEISHARGACAGFEALPYGPGKIEPNGLLITHVFGQLAEQEIKNRKFRASTHLFSTLNFRTEIAQALEEVSEPNLRSVVEFLSAYETRDHRSKNANAPIEALRNHIAQVLQNSRIPFQLELVPHNSTKQSSIRVTLPGRLRPNEIIVLGGHVDSTNQDWFGPKLAPGADDNASGSSNLVEALRILVQQQQPERTIELMWYAGEEGGLLGSAEIARDYKARNRDVIGVLQLDMTFFPGDGEFVIGSMTDFTSAWLRSYLESLNGLYIKARIIDDKCGYGCSDHASWHRQGFPALMPSEATFKKMNRKLHTANDVIDSAASFRHSAIFTKIAIAIAMDLGNSQMRQP
jgi:bacterial leucyl aminopeptidase